VHRPDAAPHRKGGGRKPGVADPAGAGANPAGQVEGGVG
jgi:hypothetical protein